MCPYQKDEKIIDDTIIIQRLEPITFMIQFFKFCDEFEILRKKTKIV